MQDDHVQVLTRSLEMLSKGLSPSKGPAQQEKAEGIGQNGSLSRQHDAARASSSTCAVRGLSQPHASPPPRPAQSASQLHTVTRFHPAAPPHQPQHPLQQQLQHLQQQQAPRQLDPPRPSSAARSAAGSEASLAATLGRLHRHMAATPLAPRQPDHSWFMHGPTSAAARAQATLSKLSRLQQRQQPSAPPGAQQQAQGQQGQGQGPAPRALLPRGQSPEVQVAVQHSLGLLQQLAQQRAQGEGGAQPSGAQGPGQQQRQHQQQQPQQPGVGGQGGRAGWRGLAGTGAGAGPAAERPGAPGLLPGVLPGAGQGGQPAAQAHGWQPPTESALKQLPVAPKPWGYRGVPSEAGTHAEWWRGGGGARGRGRAGSVMDGSVISYPRTAVTDRGSVTPTEMAVWETRMSELEKTIEEEKMRRKKFEMELQELQELSQSRGMLSTGGIAIAKGPTAGQQQQAAAAMAARGRVH